MPGAASISAMPMTSYSTMPAMPMAYSTWDAGSKGPRIWVVTGTTSTMKGCPWPGDFLSGDRSQKLPQPKAKLEPQRPHSIQPFLWDTAESWIWFDAVFFAAFTCLEPSRKFGCPITWKLKHCWQLAETILFLFTIQILLLSSTKKKQKNQPLRLPRWLGPLPGQMVRARRGFAARLYHHGAPGGSHSATGGPHDVRQGQGLSWSPVKVKGSSGLLRNIQFSECRVGWAHTLVFVWLAPWGTLFGMGQFLWPYAFQARESFVITTGVDTKLGSAPKSKVGMNHPSGVLISTMLEGSGGISVPLN